jgi:MoaA/NifB/PqqE/SkfB family radical SAM enzyme
VLAPVPSLPPRLQLEVTNRCALGCASCARHHWDPAVNPIGDLTPELLTALAPFLEGAIEVTLGGYGDPTESDMLLPALRAAKTAGCSVRLITGGAKLTEKLVQELAEAGLDRLVLSMDGARDDTLKALRGVPKRAFLKWIRAAVAARNDGLRPIVQLNVVVQWANLDELVDLVELCHAEGVAGIHAFHLKAYTPATEDRCLLTDADRARPAFEAAHHRAQDLGVFLSLPPLNPAPIVCMQPFEHVFVRHDGAVRGCCSALFDPPLHGLVAGQITPATTAEDAANIWRAPLLEQYRAAVRAADDTALPSPCVNCAFRLPTVSAHRRPLQVLA